MAGHLRLDYGLHEDTDPFGNPIGTVHPYERTEAWGVGVSPLQLLEAIRDAGSEPGPPRETWPVDFAVGVQHKHTVLALAPGALGGVAEADCLDWG